MKKGRFSQPRNGHLGDPVSNFNGNPPRRDPDPQDDWNQGAPQQSSCTQNDFDPIPPQQDFPWQQESEGQNDWNQEFDYQQPRSPKSSKPEGKGILWGILCFFFPLVGLILFLCWKKKKPNAARSSGIGGLIGLIVQLVVVLVLIIGGSLYYNHMLDKVNYVEMAKPTYPPVATEAPLITEAPDTMATTEATEPPTTEPPVAQREDYVNFLIVGQAARDKEAERFADTMLVCTLNKFDNSLTVTSLLRDSFVQPPPFRNKYFGQIKLTTVYHLGSYYDNGNVAGSMELINATLYDNFGLEIDYNIEVNFDVFTAIVNALGGVDLELTEPEAKYLTKYFESYDWSRGNPKYDFEPGMTHLSGSATLAYARMRKAEGDGESDIKRTARQRKLMEVVMQKFKTMSPADLQNLANEVLPMVTTNMSKDEITGMLKTVIPMLPTMEFKSGGTCPEKYSGVMVDIYHDGMYHSVLKFIPQETKKHMREITLGEIDGVPAGSKP